LWLRVAGIGRAATTTRAMAPQLTLKGGRMNAKHWQRLWRMSTRNGDGNALGSL
jgi:hypothetical protein